MPYAFASIAFTPAVRAAQDRNGASQYARFLEADRQGGDLLGPEERSFIEARDGFYQATVSEIGWPYVQFRGGAPGFLKALDDQTIAYADLRGNRQYLSVGNLTQNDRISLILMDYPNARRLKIWGRASLQDVDDTARDVLSGLFPATPAERIVSIKVDAFDWNCPRHIPQRLTALEAGNEITALRDTNSVLKAEIIALRRAAHETTSTT